MAEPLVFRVVRRTLDVTAALVLLAIAVLAFFMVLARYVLGMPTPWAEELLRLLFVWLVFLGAASTRHMRVDLVDSVAGATTRRVMRLAAAAVGGGLLLLFIVQGLDLVELTSADRYTALPISVQWLYYPVVLCGCLWLALLLAGLIWTPAERESSEP